MRIVQPTHGRDARATFRLVTGGYGLCPKHRTCPTTPLNLTFRKFDLTANAFVKSPTLPLDYNSTPPKTVSTDNKNVAFRISTNRIEIWNLETASIRLSLT